MSLAMVLRAPVVRHPLYGMGPCGEIIRSGCGRDAHVTPRSTDAFSRLPPTRSRARLALPVAIAVTLAVAACSGDDDDTTPTTPPPSSAPTPTEPTEPTEPDVEPTFTFGLLGPGDDELAELQLAQQRGVELAVADINAAGGVLEGPVGVVGADEDVETDLGDTLDGLIGQGANAILGPVSSATAVDLAPLVADRRHLACSASATATSVTFGNDVASFFRTVMRDDDTAAAVADRIMEVPEGAEPPATVMVVGRDDTYGAELAGALGSQLTARGATVETQLYPPRRTEFEEQVAAIVAADPAVVVVASFDEGLELLRQLDGAGFPLARIVVLDGLSRPDLATQLDPEEPSHADGIRVIRSTGDRAITARLGAVGGGWRCRRLRRPDVRLRGHDRAGGGSRPARTIRPTSAPRSSP